jgi:hypothetical protein
MATPKRIHHRQVEQLMIENHQVVADLEQVVVAVVMVLLRRVK